MCPWQVPRQGLNECGREGGERLSPHSSVSSRHSPCALRGFWEKTDLGQRRTVTSPSALLLSSRSSTQHPPDRPPHLFHLSPTILHTETPCCACATSSLKWGSTPVLCTHGPPQQDSAYSHNPMVRVLAFPDLEHVLPHWDVTSLNTHFLSPCFWFPLWIDWPANNAAQRCALGWL